MAQVGRKWQPYRTASRYVPLESTQNQDSWSLVGPSFKWQSVLTLALDVRRQRCSAAATGGPTCRGRPTSARPTWPPTTARRAARSSKAIARRGAGSTAPPTPTSRTWGTAITSSRPATWAGATSQSTENIGYPNQQQYRYRSLPGDLNCDEAHNYDGCFTRPDSVLVYDYPNTTASGEWYNSAYFNDKITLSRKLTLNVGVRFDRYSSFLPEQGNPGTGPFATKNIFAYKGESNYPIYSTIVPRVSAIYDVTGEGRVAVQGQLRPLRGRQLRCVGQPRSGRRPTSTRTRSSRGPIRTGMAASRTCRFPRT